MNSEKIIRRNILSKECEDKENYLHWLVRGWSTEDPDQALTHFLKALDLNPGDPVVLDAIDYIQEQMDETSKVEKVVDSLLDEDNRNQQPNLTVNSNMLMEPSIAVSWNHSSINPKIFYLIYFLWLALAEIVTALSTPQVGLILHGVLLVSIFVLAAFDMQIIQYRLFLILALAPLIRLLSLTMPLLQFEFMNWYMVIGIPLVLASFIAMRLAGYKPTQIGLGLGRKIWLQALVVLTGIGLGYMEYRILQPDPLIDSLTLQQFWYPALILLIFTGFLEEFIFRGLMQRATIQAMGWIGLIFTSSVFAVLHVGYRSILDVIFVFMVGLFFSVIVRKTHSIWGVTLAHGVTNISLFLIFPLIL